MMPTFPPQGIVESGIIRPVFNVLDYGADPTGTADSQPAFQNAVNAIPVGTVINSLPTGGGTVYIPAGNYKFLSKLDIQKNNVSIRGDGIHGLSILRGSSSRNFPMIEVGAGSQFSNFTFQDFTIDSIGSLTPAGFVSGGRGIYLHNTLFSYMSRVDVKRCPAQGYELQLGSTTWIDSCVIGINSTGLENQAQNTVKVTNCIVDSNSIGGSNGISVSGGDSIIFQGNDVFGSGADGFNLSAVFAQGGLLIEGNTIYGNNVNGVLNAAAGIHVTATGGGIIIKGNRITNDTVSQNSAGIQIDAGAVNVMMEGNDMRTVSAGPTPLINNATSPSVRFYNFVGVDNRSGLVAADGSPITIYTLPPGAGQLFRISADIFATAVTGGTATYTVTWTENAGTRTMAVSASVVNTIGTATDLINPDASTNITVQLTFAAFTGTVKVAAVVEQLA